MSLTNEQIDELLENYRSGITMCFEQLCDQAKQVNAPTSAQPVAHKVICHAEGDRCHGCAHYYGKSPVCEYAAPPALSDERVREIEEIAVRTAIVLKTSQSPSEWGRIILDAINEALAASREG